MMAGGVIASQPETAISPKMERKGGLMMSDFFFFFICNSVDYDDHQRRRMSFTLQTFLLFPSFFSPFLESSF